MSKDNSLTTIKGNFELIYYIRIYKVMFIFNKKNTLSFFI